MSEFGFTEEHEMLRLAARKFAEKEIAPGARERAKQNRIPEWMIKKIADLGYIGMTADEKYGGQNMDLLSVGVVVEEFAKVDLAAPHVVITPAEFVFLLQAATEEQRQEFLPRVCRGEGMYCLGLTEPTCGTDAAALKMTAIKDGDYYVLNGEKSPVTRAMQGNGVFVFAKTDPKAGARGVSCIYVPFDAPGISRSEEWYAGMIPLNCAAVFFDSVRVPRSNLIGEEGKGFYMIMQRFDSIRALISLVALGQAQAALAEAIEYAKTRMAFGQPIAKFEAISFKIAEMATQIDAARLLCYRVLWMHTQGLKHTKEAAMAKLFVPRVAVDVVHNCILMMGHYGFSTEYPMVQRMLDAMAYEIGDGTAEAQKLVIVREMLGRQFLPYG